MNFTGFFCGVLTSATFGLIPLFTLPLMDKGMTFPSILFYRFFISAILLGVFLFVLRRSFKITKRELLTLLALSLFYDGSAVFLFWGYDYLASGVATTINFLYPVFVALIMTWFFKEKTSVWTFAAIGMALAGVALLSLSGGDGGQVSLTGVFITLLSGVWYALYIVGVNKSCVREMGALKLTFYVFLFSSLEIFLYTQVCGIFQLVPDRASDFNLTMLALIPTVISNISLVYAIKAIGSTATSVLGAMEPVTAVTVGVWVFHEPFTVTLLWGLVLIIGAVTLVILAPWADRGYRRGKFLYLTRVRGKHRHLVPYE